ncbi:MAG: hypothetical protein AB2697_12180 [Candidatus Thiodiazotropha endolucinida]
MCAQCQYQFVVLPLAGSGDYSLCLAVYPSDTAICLNGMDSSTSS